MKKGRPSKRSQSMKANWAKRKEMGKILVGDTKNKLWNFCPNCGERVK